MDKSCWDHVEHPRHERVVNGASHDCQQRGGCDGDVIRFTAKIVEGRIEELGFQSVACVHARASASVLAERVNGKEVADLRIVRPKELTDQFSIYDRDPKQRCVLLPLRVLRQCILGVVELPEEQGCWI